LSPRPAGRAVNLLVDVFFTSLAEKHKENVIGIILSGSANDGTRGMKAIKYAGGLTFAQDDTAKFNSMPQSAIAAGVVDFILPPDKIAKELVRISKHPYISLNGIKKHEDEIDNNSTELKIILNLLQRAFGVNFSLYKMSTIKRRIMRRMLLYKVTTLKEYLAVLDEKKDEAEFLFNDLLINVTSFFRDAEAFRYLKSSLFPRLLKVKKPGDALRIWVTACSTGEEAYSMAMILLEIQDREFTRIPIQIFATDLSYPAVSKARIGVYTKQEVELISPKRLQRFFTRADGGFRISQTVRDMVVFAPHNLLNDPPFSRIDFISCFNLLIYFDTTAQKKALAAFHYALRPEGYLILGKSETIGSSTQLFSPFHKKLKVYSRKKNSGTGIPPPPDTRYSRLSNPAENAPDSPAKPLKAGSNANELDNAINSLLLSRYVPASVVINQHMEILQFRGSTSLYLEHPEGRATLNILKMARPEIAFELRNAISKAFKTKKPVQKKGVALNGGRVIITLEAVPLNTHWDEPVLLILFKQQEFEEHSTEGKKTKNGQTVNERKIIKLEEEMAAYRDELRSISHHHEAAMEELQSANEEVVSSNEELRSINEELETSKEEIQSANEELATTNQELQTRNELLNESYTFSEAVISTIHDPMIVLDKDLRVKTANKSFYKKFHLTEAETEGMVLYDLGNRQWNIPELRELLEDIISKNSSFKNFEVELDIPKLGKIVLNLNGRRILQQAHREQLILLAIADITDSVNKQQQEKKLLEERLEVQAGIAKASRLADEYIRNVFMQAPVSIIVYKGPSFIIDLMNEKAVEMWGISYENAIGKSLFDLPPGLREGGLDEMLGKVYKSGEPYIAHEFPTRFSRDGEMYSGFFNFVLQPVYDLKGDINGIAAVGADVTREVIARRKIEESESRYHNLIYSSTSMVAILHGKEMIIEIANDAILESWGKGKDIIGKPLFDVLPEIVGQGFDERLREVYSTGKPYYAYELPVYLVRHGKNELVYFTFVYQAQRNIKGEIEGVAIIATEVTPQAIYREKIKESARQFHFIADAMPQKVWTADAGGNRNYFNQKWIEYTGLSLEELKDVGMETLVHPDDLARVQNYWEESIATGKEYELEIRLRAKDGKYRWHLSRGEAYRDEGGKINLWVGTDTEIQKQKMQALEFEDAVFERTKELQQKNVELRKMNKELESFTYVSSHDLQEPLRKIQIFVNLILMNEGRYLTPTGTEYFEKVLKAAERMQILIEDLLAFSRINMGEKKVEIVDLGEIIGTIRTELKEIIEEKNVTFEIGELCQARIIPFQFHQLMQNLIVNAIKFADANRSPYIIIKSEIIKGADVVTGNLAPGNSYCHICIEDNGIGFEHEFEEQIFELFQRLHGQDEYPGTGIGLAIAKKIVENHNGTIRATSELNKGTRFDIYLPADTVN
jgi:two-component system CheB/CheR fusion protein